MLLQVLDDGRLTDSLGHVVDFKNTILIMTSNLGTSLIGKRVSPGFLQENDEASYEKMKERVLEELKRTFRPEFLNRIDDIIVFHALGLDHIKQIIRLMIGRINKQLADKGIGLVLSPAAETALVEKGYDPTYGARQLRRTIQKYIEPPLRGHPIDLRPGLLRRRADAGRGFRGRGEGDIRRPRAALRAGRRLRRKQGGEDHGAPGQGRPQAG